jgi:hypothetical protein
MTWLPVYTLTHRLLSTIRKVGEALGEIKAFSEANGIKAELALEARVLSARAAVVLDGRSLSFNDVKRLIQGGNIHLGEAEREALNYHEARRVLFESVRSGGFELDFDTLYWVLRQTMSCKVYRPAQHEVLNASAIARRDSCEEYVALADVSDMQYFRMRIAELIQFVNQQIGAIDPIILAAIFHRQAILLGLDQIGGGKAVWLLTSALLGKAGLNMFELLSIEHYSQCDTDRYLIAVGTQWSNQRLGLDTDITSWLEYFAEGLFYDTQRVTRYFTKLALNRSALEPHLQRIIDHVERYGSISCREYGTITMRGFQALTRDFDILVRLGLIESKGHGQGIYYVLSQ